MSPIPQLSALASASGLSLLAAFGAIAIKALPAKAQLTAAEIAQTPVQIVPANPLPAPTPGSRTPTEALPTEDLNLQETEAEPNQLKPVPLVTPAAAGSITTYSDEGMSLAFPADWQVEMVENGLMIANVTTVGSELVATQVVRMAAPPGPVVNANIDSFIEEGSAVGRYRTVNIDGQEALVMWLSERPNELTGAIATFIGYGDETIFLFSRYSPDNETAESDILRLHTSFVNLAASGDMAEDAATPDVETDQSL